MALRGQRSSSGRWDKSRLLAAVDPELGYLAARPKQTFTLPIDTWKRGCLGERVQDAYVTLSDAGLGFSRRRLTDIWHGYLRGRVGWRAVWGLAVLGLWLDGKAGGPQTFLSTLTP